MTTTDSTTTAIHCECFPGTVTPVPRLMLPIEMARYLRLTDKHDDDDKALRALNGLVERRELRPAVNTNRRMFTRPEANRYMDELTARAELVEQIT